MQLATWDIFEVVWNTKNTILHREDSKLADKNEQQTVAHLLEFKNSKEDLLGRRRSNHFIVGFQAADIIKWTSRKRRGMVEILERLHRVQLSELRIEREGLQQITLFFGAGHRPQPHTSHENHLLVQNFII